MKKKLVLLIILSLSLKGFTQDSIVHKKFIPKKVYIEEFGAVQDSVETMVRNGDTLVMVPLDFDPFDPNKMVQVRYNHKDSVFLDLYKDVVYNQKKRYNNEERMRYWKDDIRIFFDESVPASHAKILMNFADTLSKDIDSLNISRNFDREKSNFLIYYLNRGNPTDYDPRISNSKGGYYISWNGKQQIYDGKIKINTELVKSDKWQIELLKFHFFKSLGYFKSSNKLDCSSYLSSCNTARKLSNEDMEILKYHYSYGVCKGTDLESFTELTDSMNERLKKDPNAKLYVVHQK